VNVSLLQLSVRDGDTRRNLEMLRLYLRSVKSDMYLTPEMFLTGFVITDEPESYSISSDLWSEMAELSRGKTLGIGGPLYEGGNLYNAYLIFHDGKVLNIRRKMMLFKPMLEDQVFSEGEPPGIFEIEGIKFSTLICYELRFPELFWESAKNGAQVFIVPAAWPKSRELAWIHLVHARAIENLGIVLAVNRWGKGRFGPFAGHSTVALPSGEGFEVDNGIGVVIYNLKSEEIEEARNFVAWEDRLKWFKE